MAWVAALLPWPLWIAVIVASAVIAWKWTIRDWRRRGWRLPWE